MMTRRNVTNKKEEFFNRELFFKLGGKDNSKYRYNSYNIKEFNQTQIEYLSSFFNENKLTKSIIKCRMGIEKLEHYFIKGKENRYGKEFKADFPVSRADRHIGSGGDL